MAINTNQCRLVWGNPLNGIINAAGFNSEWTAADFDSLISMDAVTGRHAATDKVNLFWEKNSNSIILRPDLELKSMGGAGPTSWLDWEAGVVTTTGGTWELVTMPGQPELKLLHQKDVTSSGWTIKSADNFAENQGFVLYWDKYTTPSTLSPHITVTFEGAESIIFYIEPRKKIGVTRIIPDGEGEKTQSWSVEIPKSFYPTDDSSNKLNVLVFYIVDTFLLLGFGGLENTIALNCADYLTTTDLNSVAYPWITIGDLSLKVTASGAGVFGFKKLKYATSGSLSTPMTFPGYVMTAAPSKEYRAIVPTGAGLTMETFAGGDDPADEEVVTNPNSMAAIEKFGIYANVRLSGDGNQTPTLKRFRIYSAPSRATMSGSALEVNGKIRTYEESWQGDQNGDFMGGNLSALIRCTGVVGKYLNIYQTKAGLVRSYLTLANQSSETLRLVSCLDTKEIKRPRFGTFDLQVNCQDITKRLRMMPNMVAETYDGRGWTDVDLMKYLGTKSGVNIRSAAITEDTTVPASYHLLNDSGDDKNPNWQFGRGTMYWDFMSRIRAFSGWILSPDTDSGNREGLYFRPKPTASSTADWTFNADTAQVEDVGYKSIDLWRTRFHIYGIAAADNQSYPNKSWNYKKGEYICGIAENKSLQNEIGETRPLVIVDPTFTNWEGIGRYLLALYDYYTTKHEAPVFRINNFEAYQTMQLYQLVDWTDSQAEISGKYLLTSLNIQGDKFRASATVNTIITATGLIEGIMKEEKRRQEKGMLDKDVTVRNMEAGNIGDYVGLMRKAPGAIRIFAYDSNSEHYRAT